LASVVIGVVEASRRLVRNYRGHKLGEIFGSESHQYFAAGTSNLNGIGKKSVEWDLNDWRWDGGFDLSIVENGKGEAEKRRRIVVVEEDESYGGSGSLSLKLGGHAFPVMEADLANGKKSKPQGGSPSHSTCQVEGCGADLSDSKDYHRRHKVCEMHAKASSAVVRNAIQRFCQQCSRLVQLIHSIGTHYV
ncbi:hypothetical protein BHE74_00054307, partial [Ensete ventricosum]